MKVKVFCLLCLFVFVFAGGGFSQKNKRMGYYAKAAEEFVATLGADTDFKARGDALRLEMLRSTVRLRKRIKFSEGMMNATGAVTTGSGAAASVLSPILTDDASKKLIGMVSSLATTALGGVQILISKMSRGSDYVTVCKGVLDEWDLNESKDKAAYVELLTKAEATKDSFKRFARYTTGIDDAKAPKKVKKKELMASFK